MLHVRRTEDDQLPGFRLRGLEVTRLESFSDAVFGFALTLLVVSLDVPKTWDDLATMMRGFPAFAICFLFLTLIWRGHYRFCRRYGLDDARTLTLTGVMLFLVLFFVYPLKFLFNFSLTALFGAGNLPPQVLTRAQFADLMTIYGLGFAAVYLALYCLYAHAYRLRDSLELNELERMDTRYQMRRFLILIAVGLLSAGIAHIPSLSSWSGMTYATLFPLLRADRLAYFKARRKFRNSAPVSPA